MAAVDGGMPARKAASVFQVSVSYVYKALIRRRTTGAVEASPVRGHRPRLLSVEQEAALEAHIKAHPDLTLAELKVWLEAEHGVRPSSGALWAAVDRLGLTYKKNAARRRTGSARRCPPAPDLGGVAALR